MILGDLAIADAIERGSITISPFDPKNLGSNSYDVHLSKHLAVYRMVDMVVASLTRGEGYEPEGVEILDAKLDNPIRHFDIDDGGYVLRPGVLYLGSTVEYTETRYDPVIGHVVADISGKSSVGRLGICVEVSAGMGDVGFKGHWTLELMAIHPVRIYPGMPIAQLRYSTVMGDVRRTYTSKPSAKYVNNDPRPQSSRMWRNFT